MCEQFCRLLLPHVWLLIVMPGACRLGLPVKKADLSRMLASNIQMLRLPHKVRLVVKFIVSSLEENSFKSPTNPATGRLHLVYILHRILNQNDYVLWNCRSRSVLLCALQYVQYLNFEHVESWANVSSVCCMWSPVEIRNQLIMRWNNTKSSLPCTQI